MVEADIGSRWELVLRYLVVALCATFITLKTGRYEIAIWLGGFLVTNGFYSWRLARVRSPVAFREYGLLVALFVLSATIYTSCAVYLFMLGSTAFSIMAVAALVAQALFNLSRHRRIGFVAVYDTVLVAAAGLFFGFSSLDAVGGDLNDQIVVVVSTLGVCSYYVIAQFRKIQTYDQLQRSREEAAQTQKMRAVGQLTAGVAHEFNNLLAAIRNNIELAKLSRQPKDITKRLDGATRAVDLATRLTSQLLSFSRKAHLVPRSVEIDAFWRAEEAIIPRVIPAGINVEFSVAPDLQHLYCDADQLEIALVNLIVNARDAISGEGHIWISSRLATQEDLKKLKNGSVVQDQLGVIEIRDDGRGIPQNELDRVIEPFFTTKEAGKGTGLGLPMVKGFCEQSGGGFMIESSPRGTAVLMALPTAHA